MSYYDKICRERCEWCAEGSTPFESHLGQGKRTHKIYPMNASGGHRSEKITTGLSEYFPCTGPSPLELIEEMAATISKIKDEL